MARFINAKIQKKFKTALVMHTASCVYISLSIIIASELRNQSSKSRSLQCSNTQHYRAAALPESPPLPSIHRCITATTAINIAQDEQQRHAQSNAYSDNECRRDMLGGPVLAAVCLAGYREACDAVAGHDVGYGGVGGDVAVEWEEFCGR